MNEDMCRELRRSVSEETRSTVQEEHTVDEVEEWIPSSSAVDLGVVLSLSWVQWTRAHVQVFLALLGDLQGG